jgi:hypothetical protein
LVYLFFNINIVLGTLWKDATDPGRISYPMFLSRLAIQILDGGMRTNHLVVEHEPLSLSSVGMLSSIVE